MGWTYTHKEREMSIKEFFDKEFSGDSGKVLDCAVKNQVAYIAYERTNGGGQREVFAVICLLHYKPRDHYNFGYKDMDECMGPCAAECPRRILDLLTDTDDKIAGRWREACRDNMDRGKVVNALRPGAVIEFDRGLTFNGRLKKRLRVVSKKPLVFVDPEDPTFRCRIRRATLIAGGWKSV